MTIKAQNTGKKVHSLSASCPANEILYSGVFFRQRLWDQQVAQYESVLMSITVVKMENRAAAAHEYPWNGQELQAYLPFCSAQLV